MNNFRTLLFFLICVIHIVGCSGDDDAVKKTENSVLPTPWWESIPPIVINDDEFYGQPCSVTKVSDDAGVESGSVIFKVPSRLMTYCADSKAGKNYLEYDGEYIILNVDRQTVGAGSWTGERYRSSDFESWEEYIGVTWLKGGEYEAWRKLGSTSSKADSIKKVVRE